MTALYGNDRRRVISIFFLCLAFLAIAGPRLRFPDLDHGDEFSDACMLAAGKNFERFGFAACHFLPYQKQQVADLAEESPYTHYPPLPQLINGWLRVLFHTDSLVFFRAVALLASLLGVVFWYLFMERLFRSQLIGFLSGLLLIFNPFFIFGADSLLEISYADFFRSLTFFVFIVMLQAHGPQRKRLFALLWAVVFVGAWVTIEYYFYMALFFPLFKLLFRNQSRDLSWKAVAVLVAAIPAAVLLHFLQNAWYFGSLREAFIDYRSIAGQRIMDSRDAPMAEFSFMVWLKTVLVRNFSLALVLNAFLLGCLAFFSYVLFSSLPRRSSGRAKARVFLRLLCILAVCGMSWYFFFPAHAFAHRYVHCLVKHVVPAGVVALTMMLYIIYAYIEERAQNKRAWRTGWVLLTGGLLAAGLLQSELPVTPAKKARARNFSVLKGCLSGLREQSSPSDLIGVNYFRHPFIWHYTDRNTVFIADKETLLEQDELPAFFIFVPYQMEQAQELFELLNDRYTLLYECKSERMPSLFFKRKNDG